MTWPEDELRRLREEKSAEQQRLAQEAAEKEQQARQARFDLEARIARAPQENAEDVIRFKQMLDARGVPRLLGDIKRHLGGVVIFKESKASFDQGQRVAKAAYGLVRITAGQTTHHKGGGSSDASYTNPETGSTTSYRGERQERYNYDLTPFDIVVIAIGIKHEVGWDDNPKLYSLAEAGSFDRKVHYPTGLLSSFLSRVPLSATFEPTGGGIFIDSEYIGSDYSGGATQDPRFAISGSIDPYIADLHRREEDRFSPTQDPAADKEAIRGILAGELGKIAT